MNFDPQKFSIGVMDFFSILLPGALLTWLLMDEVCRAGIGTSLCHICRLGGVGGIRICEPSPRLRSLSAWFRYRREVSPVPQGYDKEPSNPQSPFSFGHRCLKSLATKAGIFSGSEAYCQVTRRPS